jgi:hypothetical protein
MRVEVSGEDDGNHLLSNLHQFPTVTHLEILHLVERRRPWSTGLSAVDVNLLGSVAFVEGAQLWKRDKRLRAVATEVGVPVVAGLVTTPAGGCPAARRDLRGVDLPPPPTPTTTRYGASSISSAPAQDLSRQGRECRSRDSRQ